MDNCKIFNLNGTNYTDRCQYVRNSKSCDFDAGFINYFEWQYCGFKNVVFPTILMFLWFLVLLVGIAVTADSFFAPCLVVVTRILRMSQNLAGVTLLALGNGAADVFSSLSAVMSSSKPNVGLALGSIIGAGILVNAITAGIIMIIVPFTIMRRPIIKDLVFYFIASVWTMFILIRRQIELWSAIVFLTIYILYVLITGISRVLYVKYPLFQHKPTEDEIREEQNTNSSSVPQIVEPTGRQSNGGQINPTFFSNENFFENSLNSISDNKNTESSSLPTIGGLSLYGNENSNHLEVIRMQSFKSNKGKSAIHRRMGSFAKLIVENEQKKEWFEKHTVIEVPFERKRTVSLNTINDLPAPTKIIRFNSMQLPNTSKTITIKKTHEERIEESKNEFDEVQTEAFGGKSSTSSECPIITIQNTDLDESKTMDAIEFPGLIKHFLLTILPFEVDEWNDQSILSKIFTIIQSPVMFILTLTTPVVEDETYLDGWCKILNCLHCIFAPLIWITFAKVTTLSINGSQFYAIYLVLIIGFIAAIVVAITSKSDTAPVYFPVYAFIGFITAIFWIYAIANEIVNILETFGKVFKISQTILGLSVLAFANSIGDLVSNITLARKGYPKIAYAACIGGPLFNLLVGIGLPFTIATISKRTILIELKSETIVLIFTIMLITAMNIIALPLMQFQLKPFYGIVLIIIYVLFFIFVILFASNVIKLTP